MAVAGEEQGLLGAAHWAQSARERNARIEAMITNDIVGNSHDETGQRDAGTLRLFAEGVPAGKELTEEWQRRLETGGENDSPARELARTLRDAAQRYVPEMTVKVVFRRDRYLRGGDHIPFLADGYAAVRFTEAHEDFRHQHQDVRMVDGVQYGDLPQFVDFDYLAQRRAREPRGLATLARAPAAARGRAHRDAAAREPDDAVVARQSGARSRRLRDRLARHHVAVLAGRGVRRQRHARLPCRCRRTTISSRCARSAQRASAASPRIRCSCAASRRR